MHKVVLDRRFDLRHVACHALASRTSIRMMSMRTDRPLQSRRISHLIRVTAQAQRISRQLQACYIRIAMGVMAVKTPQLPVIHIALHKVIALHSVLVRRQVSVLVEVRHTRLQVFQLPYLRQPLSRQIPHWPVIDFPVP